MASKELLAGLLRARHCCGHQTLITSHSIIRRGSRPCASRGGSADVLPSGRMLGRVAIALLVVGLVTSACASESGTGAGEATPPDADKIERCTDRLLTNADDPRAAKANDARQYAERTYCSPFAERGWVYDDGALSINAYRWLTAAGSESCSSAEAGEPARTVPCDELAPPGQLEELDCALLHHVRKSEVAQFLSETRPRPARCDDGTPVIELGVP